ncbi:MAG: hypothetical protein KIG74_04575 [Clostridiaceae bacterium]|nr:hypothetical protein [Clostridiaceae bacterium]
MQSGIIKRQCRQTRGAAMILVLCILAVFFALGISLLMAASSLNAAAQQKLKQEYCYELAKSFSFALRDQLDASDGDESKQVETTTVESAENTLPETIFLLTNRLDYADEAINATCFLSTGETLGEDYGTVSVSLRKEEYTDAGATEDAQYDCMLYITVRVEKYGTSFDYTTVYLRQIEEKTEGELQYYYKGRPVAPHGSLGSNSWFYLDGDKEKVKENNIYPDKVTVVGGDSVSTKYSFWYQNGGPS